MAYNNYFIRLSSSASLLLLSIFCIACGNSKSNGNTQSNSVESAPVDTITAFVLPTIPTMLNTPELRADYLVRHYWDNVNFADSNYIHHPEVIEQAWADYINLMQFVSPQVSDSALKDVFTKAEKERKCYLYMMEMADKYLYDPNSPMRNEELYISVLDALLESPILNDTEKIRPQHRRELAQKNRIGTKAIDFTYTLESGKQGHLYGLTAPYTILFINNPGCQACSETIEALKSAPSINEALARKQVKILSLYPDTDLEEWHRHLSDFPKEWVLGYDKGQVIEQNNLYDLKAIPTLYLLDKEKTVLLKDVMAGEIEEYLSKKPF